MKDVWKVVGGIGALIALFLLASNAEKVEGLVRTLGDASIKGIATLQGRQVKGVTY